MNQKEYIREKLLKELDLLITDLQADQLLMYYTMMIEKNKVMNLTRITDFEEVVDKHFVDSLAIVKVLDPKKFAGCHMIDLGSGAGLPGVPIKIVWPEIDVLMIDSVGKKMNFVNEVVSALGLEHVKGMHARAEELAHQADFRESFDLCTSRAVANMATLSEYCLPFVKTGGCFVAYKSGESEEEIQTGAKAIRVMGGANPEILNFELCSFKRTFVKIIKKVHTKKEYPRKAGTPSKNPII